MASYTYTHVFDFLYKWTPSGSLQIPSPWPNTNTDSNLDLQAKDGFYNFQDQFFGFGDPNVITRETASMGGSGSAGALPWGCQAAEMLWNVLTPSQSGYEVTQSWSSRGGYLNVQKFNFTYNSASFTHDFGGLWLFPAGSGLAALPITSSWKAIEPLMTQSDVGRGMQYTLTGPTTNANLYPAQISTSGITHIYAKPSATSDTLPPFMEPGAINTLEPFPPGTNPDMITYGNKSTGSFDGRFFDLAGGCGISRASVSASLSDFNEYASATNLNARKSCSLALKQRRLFFPTISTGSSVAEGTGMLGSIATQFVPNVGIDTTQIFNENGGIFNVKFNLKRNVLVDMYPDQGEGSELLVYIHNVNKVFIEAPIYRHTPTGRDGYYPPDNNIIRIKNANPVMSFINPATGFLMESFNINVVQYGAVGQLVFEASGSLDDDNYFGCVIDDVSFCKVGVSTDPNLLQPETVGGAIETEIAIEDER